MFFVVLRMASSPYGNVKWALREQNPGEETGENIGESGVLRSGPRPCAANALQTTTELSGNVADLLTQFPELLALVEAWPGMTERERNAVLRAAMTGQR